MSKTCFVTAIVVVFLVQSTAFSQSDEVPKFEVAAEFTTMEREAFFFSGRRTEPGFGGRFTYNLNRVFSLEAAGYFFPKDCFTCANSGRVTQVLGGVKVGKRFDKWGVFAKARPGVVHYSRGLPPFGICLGLFCPFPIEPFRPQKNNFATDVGGVVEFYVSKRIVTRFDAGDTIIHFNGQTTNGLILNPTTQQLDPFLFIVPERTSHNFQFVTSIGFRF